MLQESREKIEMLEAKSKEQEKHSKNLEIIREENERHIKSLLQQNEKRRLGLF